MEDSVLGKEYINRLTGKKIRISYSVTGPLGKFFVDKEGQHHTASLFAIIWKEVAAEGHPRRLNY